LELETNKIISFNWYQFEELDPFRLYELLKLRQDVIVLEQSCLYPDLDNSDQHCEHLLATKDSKLVGYLRLIPNEHHGSRNCALGRIITTAALRGSGLGKKLVNTALQYCTQNYPEQKIQISAQLHLKEFYQGLGFVSFGNAYDDDGIMHIDMMYQN